MDGDNYSGLCKKRQEFIKGEDVRQETIQRKRKRRIRRFPKKEETKSKVCRKGVSKQNDRRAEAASHEQSIFRELPAVVTTLKEVIEKLTVHLHQFLYPSVLKCWLTLMIWYFLRQTMM